MKLESLTVRGFMTAFAGKEVTIDFRKLPAGLIALVGGNGEGKTTLLEAAPAGLYREMLSRTGDLKSYAMDRDSFIAASWKLDDTTWYQSRLTVDGIKGGASAALHASDDKGVRPLNDGKVSTYDGAVAKVFPPLHVFKASAFAAQNKSGSFVKAEKKDRRDIFNSLLGVDRLVRMSEAAKGAAAEVDKVRTRVKAEVDVLERETAPSVTELLTEQAAHLADAQASAERRRDDLAVCIAGVEQRLAMLSDQVGAHAAATHKVAQLAAARVDAEAALAAHVAEDLAATLAESRALMTLQLRHDEKLRDVSARDAKGAIADAEELQAITNELRTKLAGIQTKLDGNATIQGMADDIRAAVTTIERLTPEVSRLRAERDALVEQQTALATRQAENEKVIAGFTKPQTELDRATTDAALLEHVPCGGRGEFAGCQLLVNAKTAEGLIADLRAQLAGVAAANETRTALLDESRANAQALVSKKATLLDVELQLLAAQEPAKYSEKLAGSDARVKELNDWKVDAEKDAAQRTKETRGRHVTAAEQRSAERVTLVEEFEAAKSDSSTRAAARLEAAKLKQSGLSAAASTAAAAHASALDELQALENGNQMATALQAELAEKRADRDAAVTAVATAIADFNATVLRQSDIYDQRKHLTVLQGRLTRLDTELLEWQLLQKALDRDGLPALETDQAGPEISATTNQILADCFESRFSVELVTQVAKADGKGMKDEFTVLVTDNQTGDVRDISDLSGGEEVIVAEALMNAIAIYVNERSDVRILTLFRDETTGALTKENTQRYIQMLRKVMELGGFHQVLFISHDPDAYALADAQLLVASGTVTPKLPPYLQEAA
ncbi:MAG: SMC family ATPase [Acidobacteriota bacterium]|nr:SMC family ATPase [Acidobacteriota bacterium]